MNNNYVKVLEGDISLIERLEICSGVEEGKGFDIYNNRSYKDNSFKPKNDWKKIDLEVYETLKANSPNLSFYDNISLRKIPKKLISSLQKIGFENCKNGDDYYSTSEQKIDSLQNFLTDIGLFFYKIIPENYSIADINLLCISFEKPEIETIGYDTNDNKYFGLHIDNNKRYLEVKEKRPNRFSINLGKEPRYLLFVNLTINGIKMKIAEKNKDYFQQYEFITVSDLVKVFFSLYPDYPIFRLRQEPYEAYIAPTDNIIHDGSTMNKKLPDITMVFIGYFNLFF